MEYPRSAVCGEAPVIPETPLWRGPHCSEDLYHCYGQSTQVRSRGQSCRCGVRYSKKPSRFPGTPWVNQFEPLTLVTLPQCSKLLPVRQPEADKFGGPVTFLKLFFNFMFMIWDSRQQDWQLFLLSFEHWLPSDAATSYLNNGTLPWSTIKRNIKQD